MSTDDDLAVLHDLTAALEGVGRDMAEVRAGLTEESETRRLENAELRSQNALLLGQNRKLEHGRRSNRRLIYLVIALFLALALACGLGALAYSKFRGGQDDFRSYQDCVNAQNDDRAHASVEFWQHIEAWADGSLQALKAAIADPRGKASATADFLGSYQDFIDYARARVDELSGPVKGC